MSVKIENSDHVSSRENIDNVSNSGNVSTQERKRVSNPNAQHVSDEHHLTRELVHGDEGYDYEKRALAPIIIKEKKSLFEKIVKGVLDVGQVVGGVALAIGSGGVLAGAGISLAMHGAQNVCSDVAGDGLSQSIGEDLVGAGLSAGTGALTGLAGGAIAGKIGGAATKAASSTSSSGAVWV